MSMPAPTGPPPPPLQQQQQQQQQHQQQQQQQQHETLLQEAQSLQREIMERQATTEGQRCKLEELQKEFESTRDAYLQAASDAVNSTPMTPTTMMMTTPTTTTTTPSHLESHHPDAKATTINTSSSSSAAERHERVTEHQRKLQQLQTQVELARDEYMRAASDVQRVVEKVEHVQQEHETMVRATLARTTTTTTTTTTANNRMGPPARKKIAVEAAPLEQQVTTGIFPTTSQHFECIRLTTLQFAMELNAFCATHTFHSAPIRISPSITAPVPSPPVPPPREPLPWPRTSQEHHQQILAAAVNLNNNDPTTDLQLHVCRKLRELLPTSNSAALLQTAQARNWIPILLQWLNLHDRPAVQVESLLAVTSIAEFCVWSSLLPSSTGGASLPDWSSSAAMAAMAPLPPLSTTAAGAVLPPSSLLIPAVGSVPFPPLSFSHSLSREALAAFDARLATTIQSSRYFLQQQQQQQLQTAANGATGDAANANTNAFTNQQLDMFTSTNLATLGGISGGINFTPLAPPPGGSHTVISPSLDSHISNASSGYHHHAASYLPPPSPVVQHFGSVNTGCNTLAGVVLGSSSSNTSTSAGGLVGMGGYGDENSMSTFVPHGPVSAASQHVLLRHADAIPTLIALLSSPARHVYEQALWILGSIAAGDVAPPGANGGGGGGSNSMLESGSRVGHSNHGNNSGASGNNNNANLNHHEKTVSARDVILAAGVMQPLLRCLEAHPNNLSLQRIGAWALSSLLDNLFQSSSSSPSTNSANPTSLASVQQQQQQQQQVAAAASSAAAIQKQVAALSSNLNSSAAAAVAANAAAAATALQSASAAMLSQPPMMGAALPGKISSADEIDMAQLLPVLHRLLHITDSEVLSYICWCLSFLCDGPASHIAAIVTSPAGSKAKPGGLVPRLVELLLHPSWRVTKPALRTIGNIVCAECSDDSDNGGVPSTTDYTEVILECQAVPRLKELITHSNREIQKEAAWTLSNIAAGTVEQIQAVIDSGAIPPLVTLVRDERTDQEVRSEACWVVLNATSCGSDAQIELLVDEGCVSVLGVLLSEVSMVLMALEGLERVLQVEETREMIRRDQIECGEIEDDEMNHTPVLVSAALIEHARESHNSSAVIKRADRIWKQHFVLCALCRESYSRHRLSDASFCDECKCHVCSNCDCKIYHLDYQEELWAATEEQTEAKKNAKKSKNKKKKAKLKEKKASTKVVQVGISVDEATDYPETIKEEPPEQPIGENNTINVDKDSPSLSHNCEAVDDDDEHSYSPSNRSSQIDLVLYLQQTGSIIALSKLMDALDVGGDDYDDELDDYERKVIRELQVMRGQTSN